MSVNGRTVDERTVEARHHLGPLLRLAARGASDVRTRRAARGGGAFCMPFVGDRSLVLLNWSGSAESAQTTAHELGHACHNTTLVDRTYLQERLSMAFAETAAIFCETVVVEADLGRLDGNDRLALLDIDLQGDPVRFRAGYDDLLSRPGMDTAEELGRAFDFDVTDEAFRTSSLDVVRSRMADYETLAAAVGRSATSR